MWMFNFNGHGDPSKQEILVIFLLATVRSTIDRGYLSFVCGLLTE